MKTKTQNRQHLSAIWINGLLALLLAVVAGDGTASGAEETKALSTEEIVARTNRVAYYQGNDGRADVAMTIDDDQGRQRRRQFTVLRRDDQPDGPEGDQVTKEQKFFIFFNRPTDVKNTAFLVWKHMEKDDDRWLYLPALDLVKRIAAGDKRTSFVGSHFFYEDISGRNINADTHELVETTDNYYVLNNTPKDPKSVEFASYKMWIHKETFIPVKTEYYDEKGDAYRVYEALSVEKIDGFFTVTKARMSDLKTKGKTEISYQKVKYNIDLPEDIFTERYLRNPPQQYLD